MDRTVPVHGEVASHGSADESGWLVWVAFGGVVMFVAGALDVVAGLAALLRPAFFVATAEELVVALQWSVWGGLHLAWGLTLAAIGLGVVRGDRRARMAGVVIAALSAVRNVLFLGVAPVWMTIMVALDLLIVYALVVHGDALRRYA